METFIKEASYQAFPVQRESLNLDYEKKAPVVRIDKTLNKYDNIVLFPDKVKKAKEDFAKFGLPNLKKHNC